MKYLFNPATDSFEPLEPTLRDRFALGGGVIQGKKVGGRENFAEPVSVDIQNFLKRTFPEVFFNFDEDLQYGVSIARGDVSSAKYTQIAKAAKERIKNPNYELKSKQQVALEGSKKSKLKADAKRVRIIGYFKDLEKYIETNAAKYSDVDKFYKDAIKKFDTKKYPDFIKYSPQTQRNVRDPKPIGKIFDLKEPRAEKTPKGGTYSYKNLFTLKGNDASSKLRYVKDMMLINMMEKNPKMINMRDNIIKILNNDLADLSQDDIRTTKAFQKQNLKASAARPNLLRSYFNSIIKDFEKKRLKVIAGSQGVEADLRNLLNKKDISEAFRKKVRTTLNNIYQGKKYGIELRNEFTKLFGKDKPIYAPTVKKGQEFFEFEHKIGKASTGVNKLPATYMLRGSYVPSSFNYAKNINFDNKLLEFMNEYKKTKSAATETKIKNLYNNFNKKSAGYLNDLTIDFDRKAGSVIVTDKTPIFKIKNYDDYKQQFAKNLKHSQAYLSTVKGGKFAFDKKAANELIKKVLPVAGKITMGLGKVIKPLSIATGITAVTQAVNAGETNVVDLAGAYVTGDATTATTNRLLRTDEKFRNDYIANLPEIEGVETEVFDALQKEQDTEPVQTAGLKETFPGSNMDYLQAVQDGFQGSFEDFLQLQSIPQSDRPITGELDLPKMDQTMMAAQGGRVGFSDGTPDPFVTELLSGLNNTEVMDNVLKNNTPSLEESMFGTKEESNLLQRLNQTLDPRAFPYYAAQITKGVALAPEFAARLTLAAPKALADLAQGKSGVGAEFAENIDPKFTQKQVIERFGLQKILDDMDQDITGSQRTVGEILKMGGESIGPATGIGYFASAGKAANQIRKEIQKYAGSAEAAKELEKSVEEKAASLQMTRREFNTLLAGGGIVGLIKALGLDTIFPAAKQVVKQSAPIVTKGGTPKYFFDLVELIKTKGDDLTANLSTVERQKVYDLKGFTLSEDISTGKISIRKDTEGGGQYTTPDGDVEAYDGIIRKEEINYEPPETILGKDGKPVEVPDQYDEATLLPDADGGDGDIAAGLDSIDEILRLLAENGKTYSKDELIEMGFNLNTKEGVDAFLKKNPNYKFRTEKAGGGIVKLAGDDSGPPPKSGPTPHGLPYVAKNVRPIKERK